MRLKGNYKIEVKNKITLLVVVILIMVSYRIYMFNKNSIPYLFEYAKNESINNASKIINSAIYNEVYDNKDKNIIILEKNDNNEITNMSYDTDKVNLIMYKITNNLFESIDNLRSKNEILYIPFGVLSKTLLLNLSPKVPYKLKYLSNVNTSIKTNVTDYGINNSLIEVVLNININVNIILPFMSKTININKDMLITSNIVQGKIPTYYGGVSYRN